MGTGKTQRKHGNNFKVKKCKKKTWLCHRAKDTDQIQDEIENAEKKGKAITFEYDDSLPGGGQFYCVKTVKHFADARGLADHKKSRYYKRRCKELKEEKYTQSSAEWASGMTKEVPPLLTGIRNEEWWQFSKLRCLWLFQMIITRGSPAS